MSPPSAVRQILAEISGRAAETMNVDDRLADLGLDSLGRLTLAVLLEERIDQPIPDDILMRVRTVGDLDRLAQPVGRAA
ncbi:acyl carrier protein [Micromonospora aurantiaca (nom. illeg.)]|uniref:acyl carrier protein n=1 Tax=Micromonospora aurantiaca (nom. illeg.) TaxID=47850 RepID=UPI0033E68E88